MFVPIGDSPNFKTTPWVTYLLIAVNVLVFLGTIPMRSRLADPRDPAVRAYAHVIAEESGVQVKRISQYDALVFRLGFKPRFAAARDILTSMFLHAGWLHLLGNMLFLWIYGDNVEHRLGPLGYLLAYLATGVAAAGGDALLRPDSAIPSVGASGAISGVLGFYFVWFPRNRVRAWVFLFPFFADVIELPARLVLGIYLVFDNILPALLSSGSGGVAHGAHLGGFIAAAAAAFLLDRLRLRRPETAVRAPRRRTESASGSEEMRRALTAGDLPGALSVLMGMPIHESRRAIEPADKLALADGLAHNGHPRAALAVFQRLVTEHPDGPVAARAHLGAAQILMDELGMPAAAYQQLVLAMENEPDPATLAAAKDLLARMSLSGVVPRRWMRT